MEALLRHAEDQTVKYVASITAEIQASSTMEADGKTKNRYGYAFDALAAEFPADFYPLDTNALLDFSGDPMETIQ